MVLVDLAVAVGQKVILAAVAAVTTAVGGYNFQLRHRQLHGLQQQWGRLVLQHWVNASGTNGANNGHGYVVIEGL